MHHLHPVVARLPLRPFHLVRRQQPLLHELAQHLLGVLPLREDRQQLLPLHHRSRPLRRHEVAEDLAHNPLTLRADAVHRGLGVLGEGAGDTPDLLVGRASEQLPLPVPLLPQPGDGEGEERQRSSHPLHRVHHLLDQGFIFEAVALPLRRLHQRPPQRVAPHRQERRQLREDPHQRLVLPAPHQEVVPQRQEHVHVPVLRQPPEEGREPGLRLLRVEREELLELVHHQERLGMRLPPAQEHLERRLRVLEPHELSQRLGVAGQLRCQRLAQHQERRRPRSRDRRRPPRGARRHDARSHERRLARPRGTDHGEEPTFPEPPPEGLDLTLAAVETPGVFFREEVQARVRSALLEARREGRAPRLGLDRLKRHRQVVSRGDPVVRGLLQASAHDAAQCRRDRRQLRRRLLQDGRQRRDGRLPSERVAGSQELVEHHPQREEIRAPIERKPPYQLGRHVSDRAQELARPRGRGRGRFLAACGPCGHDLRQAEVEDLQPPVRRDEEVLGLQVAVKDPLGVRRLQAPCRLHSEREDLTLRRGAARHERPQRFPFEHLRDDVGRPLVEAHVVDSQDAGVVEGGDGPRLPFEAREPVGVAPDVLRQNLDRHLAPEAGIEGAVDLAHAPGPQEPPDLVRPEPRADRESHGLLTTSAPPSSQGTGRSRSSSRPGTREPCTTRRLVRD